MKLKDKIYFVFMLGTFFKGCFESTEPLTSYLYLVFLHGDSLIYKAVVQSTDIDSKNIRSRFIKCFLDDAKIIRVEYRL